jgi:D-aminoacyl-tRNA deacylase
MRIVIQRASSASVLIDEKETRSIGKGLVILVGFEDGDDENDVLWISKKIISLRIFGDAEGKMNLSVEDIKGELLLISQFTLHASTVKGNRPSFIKAARPEKAIPLYEKTISELKQLGSELKTGEFGADMKVSLVNDGPVTIMMDSKNKE